MQGGSNFSFSIFHFNLQAIQSSRHQTSINCYIISKHTFYRQKINMSFFKRKGRGRPIAARQRSASPSSTTSHTETDTHAITKSEVVLPTKKAAVNLLSAGSKRSVSQRDDSDDSDTTTRDGPGVRWTAEGSHVNAALEIIAGDEAEQLEIVKKSQDVPKSMRVGPQRTSNTIRTVTITDYQPDVCKDYKGALVPRLLHRSLIQLLVSRNWLLWLWRYV